MAQTLLATRRQQDDLVLSAPQPAFSTAQEHTARAFHPSAFGDTSHFTDASVDATAIGLLVVPEDGNIRNMVRQILSFSGTTAAVDKAWPAAPTATSLRAWRPASLPFRCTGSGSTTTAVSTDFTSITNYVQGTFKGRGYSILWLAGNNAGKASAITDFDPATGIVTFSPALTSTVAGELGIIAKLHRPEGAVISANVNQEVEEQPVIGSQDPAPSIIHNRPGVIEVEFAHRPLATAGTGLAVNPLEMGDLLGDVMTEVIGTGTTASGSPPMSGQVLNVTSASGIAAGDMILNSIGEAGLVISKSTNALTMATGHMTAAGVLDTSVIFAGANYKRKLNGQYQRTWYYFRAGQQLEQHADCMARLTVTVARAKVLRHKFSYASKVERNGNLTRWVAEDASFPILLPDTTIPMSAMGPRCLIDSVAVSVEAFSIDWGLKPTMRSSQSGMNESDGNWMDSDPITGSISIWQHNDDKSGFAAICDRMNAGTPVMILYQRGAAAKRTWACCVVAAQFQKATAQYNAKAGVYAGEFRAIKPDRIEGSTYAASLQPAVETFL